jgi:hypothetical protein
VQYALLIYGGGGNPDASDDVAALLAGPDVSGWAALHDPGSATTLRANQTETLLTDGPFIDSKEFLGGLIVFEAENLDAALAFAQQMQDTRIGGAIEVRPVRQGRFGGA